MEMHKNINTIEEERKVRKERNRKRDERKAFFLDLHKKRNCKSTVSGDVRSPLSRSSSAEIVILPDPEEEMLIAPRVTPETVPVQTDFSETRQPAESAESDPDLRERSSFKNSSNRRGKKRFKDSSRKFVETLDYIGVEMFKEMEKSLSQLTECIKIHKQRIQDLEAKVDSLSNGLSKSSVFSHPFSPSKSQTPMPHDSDPEYERCVNQDLDLSQADEEPEKNHCSKKEFRLEYTRKIPIEKERKNELNICDSLIRNVSLPAQIGTSGETKSDPAVSLKRLCWYALGSIFLLTFLKYFFGNNLFENTVGFILGLGLTTLYRKELPEAPEVLRIAKEKLINKIGYSGTDKSDHRDYENYDKNYMYTVNYDPILEKYRVVKKPIPANFTDQSVFDSK